MRGAALCGLAALLSLQACGPKVSTRRFDVRADADVNDRSPVPVALVLVKEPAFLEVANQLGAREWFARWKELERENPGAFEVREWEIVAGQEVDVEFPFRSRDGVALLVFANYRSPGAHRARVDPLKRFTLVLAREGFTVEAAR